jgi:hypothetical protein
MQPQLPNSDVPIDRALSLREQMCAHELALIKEAVNCDNSDIRRYALKSAGAEGKQRRKLDKILSPLGAWFWCFLIWLMGVAASWYALLHYVFPLDARIIGVVFVGCSITTLIYLTLSKHVLGADLVAFLRSILEKFTFWKSSEK